MATYYINADAGNDTAGNGTAGNPYLTLSKAFAVSAINDTIRVTSATNTYAIPSLTTYTVPKAGVQVIGDDPSTCIFDGGGGALANVIQPTANGALSFKYENLTFRNFSCAQVERNILDLRSWSSTSGWVDVNNCIFHSIITNGGGSAQGFINASGTGGYVKLKNCLAYDIAKTQVGSMFGLRSMQIILENCAIINMSSYGFTLIEPRAGGGGAVTATNSIFANLGTGSYDWNASNTGVDTVTYSCLYNTLDNPTLGTGCITSDPMFVNAPAADFRLRPGSPCIGTGTVI